MQLGIHAQRWWHHAHTHHHPVSCIHTSGNSSDRWTRQHTARDKTKTFRGPLARPRRHNCDVCPTTNEGDIMSTFRFIPKAHLPPIEIKPDILGIAITACDAKSTRFIPIGYSLAVDGPFKLKRRRCDRSARVLIRVARNLALTRPDYARDLLTFAATLLDSRGGTFEAV